MLEEHVRRLDVGPVDQSTNQQKASGHGFGHRAKKSEDCAKAIGVAESTSQGAIGRRRGRCVKKSDEASRDQ